MFGRKRPEPFDPQLLAAGEWSPVVQSALLQIERGADPVEALSEAVVCLAGANARLADKVLELELLRPRRIAVNGKAYRWDAPDDLVPIERVAADRRW